MADQSPDSQFLKIVRPAIGSAVGAALGWLTGGSGHVAVALTTGLAVVGGICALAFSLMYQRYLGVLAAGGARKGSPARADYDALCESLSGENVAARIYSSRLHAFLDWIERFFGDVGMADRTLFPHAFGLRSPAPLWTAPAFERCLLLALAYPVATILLIWAISGHVGPAEAALGLPAGISGWRRVAFAASVSLLCSLSLSWRSRVQHLGVVGLALAGALAGAVAATFVGVSAVAYSIFIGLAVTLAGAGAIVFDDADGFVGAVCYAHAGAIVGAIVVAIIVGFPGASADGVVKALAVAMGATIISVSAIKGMHGTPLAVFVVAMIALCIGLPAAYASTTHWNLSGPILLFAGLLSLLNAPFDWTSLGLTRALLRRGLELGGWWPYFFSLIDAALASVIITLLAATMVVGVQAFDTVAVHGGGNPVLPLRELFDGVATHPSDPEFWWLYALLISSMIPSLINMAMGGFAFVRGVPGLGSLVLRFMYDGKAVAPHNRKWIALVLTIQVFVGGGLGLAAQTFLAYVIIWHVLPQFGFHILDVARDIADFNLPERVWALFIGPRATGFAPLRGRVASTIEESTDLP
jgi:hypothetical protein